MLLQLVFVLITLMCIYNLYLLIFTDKFNYKGFWKSKQIIIPAVMLLAFDVYVYLPEIIGFFTAETTPKVDFRYLIL